MANRYHNSQTTKQPLSAPKGREPGTGSGAVPALHYGGARYPKPTGPAGPSRNKVKGFTEIHCYPQQKLADDFSGQGMMGGAAKGASLGATMGSVFPVIGTAIGAVVGAVGGGLMGAFGGEK